MATRVFSCMRIGNVEAALVVLKGADTRRYPEAGQVAPFFDRAQKNQDGVLGKQTLVRAVGRSF